MAIEVVDRLEYDFADSGRGARLHAVRVATFDAAVPVSWAHIPPGRWLRLAKGWRPSSGGSITVTSVGSPWTSPRRWTFATLLPDGPRQSSHRGSALDLDWIEQLDPTDPILVTAQGLLPYFQREQVYDLIAGIAERLPGSLLVFDAVPEAMLNLVRRASGRERDLAVELWTWLFNPRERAAIRALPGVEELRDLAPPLTPV